MKTKVIVAYGRFEPSQNRYLVLNRQNGTKEWAEQMPVDILELPYVCDAKEMSKNSLAFPMRIYFGVNTACNLSCKLCYADHKAEDFYLERSEWLPMLDYFEKYGNVELRLGESGEPTIDPDKCINLLSDIKERKMYVSMNTNGQFDRWLVDELCQNELINEPIISIDGDKDHHDWNRGKGAFDKALEALRLFSTHAKPTPKRRVNIILTQKTLGGVPSLLKKIYEAGAVECSFLPLRPFRRAKAYWRDILTVDNWLKFITETLPILRQSCPGMRIRTDYDVYDHQSLDRLVDKKNYCSAGREAFACKPVKQADGKIEMEIYGCGYVAAEGGEYVAGSIPVDEFPEKFGKLWHDDEHWRPYRLERSDQGICEGCSFYGKRCFGQCVALRQVGRENEEFKQQFMNCPFKLQE